MVRTFFFIQNGGNTNMYKQITITVSSGYSEAENDRHFNTALKTINDAGSELVKIVELTKCNPDEYVSDGYMATNQEKQMTFIYRV